MKTLTLIIALTSVALSTPSALAHIEPGIWKGVASDGTECALEVFEQTFENGMRHPLNERIRVRLYGDEFMIYHPRAIDLATGAVTFNHDLFEGILATSTGSNALVIDMAHTEEFEGPTGYRWIRDNWKTKSSVTVTCRSLRHLLPN